MVRAVSLAGCFQPGAPLSLAAEKQLLLRHCLFDGNKYKPFGAVCQRVVSQGKGKISRVKQKETSERMSLFAVRWQQFGYFCFFPSPFLICKQDRKTGINNLIVSALLPHFLCAIRQYFVAHTHIYLDSQHVH